MRSVLLGNAARRRKLPRRGQLLHETADLGLVLLGRLLRGVDRALGIVLRVREILQSCAQIQMRIDLIRDLD